MMPEECPAGITCREEASPTAARGVGRPRDYGDFLELPPPRIRLIDATWRRTPCISCARDSGSATATMPGETLQQAKDVKQVAEHTTIGSPACPRRMEQVKIGDGPLRHVARGVHVKVSCMRSFESSHGTVRRFLDLPKRF
jgi:hypothetical protein